MTKSDDEYSGESGHRANADRIIDHIHDVLEDHGRRFDPDEGYSSELSWDDPDDREFIRSKFDDPNGEEAILPGFGETGRAENAYDDCGNPHPFGCPECGHVVEFGRTCSMSVCTRCGVAWCRDLGIKKSAKLRRVRKEKHQHTPADEHQKLHHQIISPPPGWFYDLARSGLSMSEAQKVTKKVCKYILDEMRAQGLLVRHSYRGASEDGSLRPDAVENDMGAWKERLNSDRKWLGDVRDELGWMPHYHAVVVGDWLEGGNFTKRIEDQTGWVIHRIADENNVSIESDGEMVKRVLYTLSHADIMVRDQANRSAAWEVGSFQADPIRSSSRFTPTDADLEWSDRVVRRKAEDILGLRSGTTECGAGLPAVDDPDQLARNILEEMYSGDETPDPAVADVDEDAVLYHVSEGSIRVKVSTLQGGGGDVSVSGWGSDIDLEGGAGDVGAGHSGSRTAVDGGEEPINPIVDVVESDEELEDDQEDDEHEHGDACGCDDQHGDDQEGAEECDGTLEPLEVLRNRGLVDDQEWIDEAPHATETLEADREWDDDLDPWRTSSPGDAIDVRRPD